MKTKNILTMLLLVLMTLTANPDFVTHFYPKA